jgi:hypothetical protein
LVDLQTQKQKSSIVYIDPNTTRAQFQVIVKNSMGIEAADQAYASGFSREPKLFYDSNVVLDLFKDMDTVYITAQSFSSSSASAPASSGLGHKEAVFPSSSQEKKRPRITSSASEQEGGEEKRIRSDISLLLKLVTWNLWFDPKNLGSTRVDYLPRLIVFSFQHFVCMQLGK